jgi:exosortase A
MPLDVALQPAAKGAARMSDAWRRALLQLGLAWAALVTLASNTWAEMANQWWNASTYNHILLVPPILIWLVRLRWHGLARLEPVAWWPGVAMLAGGILVWAGGTAAGINLVAGLGAVTMLQAAVAAQLGPRVTTGLLFPLGYMLFLVPFGDEIIPALQAITARLAVALTHASGVRATIDGVFIDTPVGVFEVAEACSGIKFLVAMVALGTLVAHLCFASLKRRAVFMLVAVIVPVFANGVRAWGTIFVAQSQGVEFAAGFDHIVYGWIFFAVVMAVVLGASWRFFDRSPDDPLVDPARIETSPLLTRLAGMKIGGWHSVAAILVLTAAGAWMDRVADLP